MKSNYLKVSIIILLMLAGSACRVKLATGSGIKGSQSLMVAESKKYALCRKKGSISAAPKLTKNTFYHIEAFQPENRSLVYVHFIERESLPPEAITEMLKSFDYNSQTWYMPRELYHKDYGHWINYKRSSLPAEMINSKFETISGKTFRIIHNKQEYLSEKKGEKIARYYVNAIYHGEDYTLEFFIPGGSDVGGQVNGGWVSPFQDRAEQDLVKYLRECLAIY